jgi:diketogulonate reductase-like aldo/keto reductase
MTITKHASIPTTLLPSGRHIPILGQGTWGMGEQPSKRAREVSALRAGLDEGLALIDTAEMYGEGGAEEVVGEAIEGRRQEVFLVSKVYPHNATRDGAIQACERTLRRLKTDYLDLYLLHWREQEPPLEETFSAFRTLVQTGKIRDYGVSNFDVNDMEEAAELPGGDGIVTNQVLYNPRRRGIEFDLVPYCHRLEIPIMAYSPLEGSGAARRALLENGALKDVAARHDATTAQVALAWVLRSGDIVAIPKAATVEHLRENRAALGVELSKDDLADLDRAFPPPTRKVPLETS